MRVLEDIRALIWLFPILFIFHDFEEIVFMKPWINRNEGYLNSRFPKLSKSIILHFSNTTTSAFALGVAEEFILICVITIISYFTNWYYLWFGTFIAFSIHLIVHCIQALILKGYVPCVVTSVLCLPICFCFLRMFMTNYEINIGIIVLFSFIAIAIMILNLAAIHKGMLIFDRWLDKYQHK